MATLSLISSSWKIVKNDKETLAFSFLNLACWLGLFAAFVYTYMLLSRYCSIDPEILKRDPFQYGYTPYIPFIVFVFFSVLIEQFFSACIVSCAIMRFAKMESTFFGALKAVFFRLPALLGWVVICSFFRLVFDFIKNRWLKAAAEVTFSLTSFFVVPIIIVEEEGPLSALSKSTGLLCNTWGDQLKANFGFGIIFWIMLVIPIFFGVLLGYEKVRALPLLWTISSIGSYYVLLSVFYKALFEVFRAALYVYVTYQKAPDGFDEEQLHNAIQPKF